MAKQNDLLFEIGTEELPAKQLFGLAQSLGEQLQESFKTLDLTHGDIQIFATPRRLAILVPQLQALQASRSQERRGPALSVAFDSQGQPTPAGIGFARSCGVDIIALDKLNTPEGSWLVYRFQEKGKTLQELAPAIIRQALNQLPSTKNMRWGAHSVGFVRPVHWAVLLFGDEIIETELLGQQTQRLTYGHRFHAPTPISLANACDYEAVLQQQGKVIPNYTTRLAYIREAIQQVAQTQGGKILLDESLLNEVTGLVEWPVALFARFEARFLELPQEVLIAAMQGHQKCFPVLDAAGQLLPGFITVANIVSQDAHQVILGNERVMRARLSDADFFYRQDSQQSLMSRTESLSQVIFQAKLGSLADKSLRIANLAEKIMLLQGADQSLQQLAKRAGQLAKADLVTTMVGEFPELQGVMGSYYATQDGEAIEVATAIREHYLPRSAADTLPVTPVGCALALADRLDTLVGLFGIHQPPTGNKDPFGLRRAAIAILRILIERQWDLDLHTLLTEALNGYQPLPNKEVVGQVQTFILERLQPWYQEQGIGSDKLQAVLAVTQSHLANIARRIDAVNRFCQIPEATALIAANKRVANLLKQTQQDKQVAAELTTYVPEPAEQVLYEAVRAIQTQQQHRATQHPMDYYQLLMELAKLREPIDRFFDEIMVMVEDDKIRQARLNLLLELRHLFLAVADISLLQE